jgi:hypothetical protein
MIRITADLAIALGMVPECLAAGRFAAETVTDEHGAGWVWFREKYEDPRRVILTDAKKREIQHAMNIHLSRRVSRGI